MRTAEKWQKELAGETSLESIRAIQADAILGAIDAAQRVSGRQAIIAALAVLAADTLSPNDAGEGRVVASPQAVGCGSPGSGKDPGKKVENSCVH